MKIYWNSENVWSNPVRFRKRSRMKVVFLTGRERGPKVVLWPEVVGILSTPQGLGLYPLFRGREWKKIKRRGETVNPGREGFGRDWLLCRVWWILGYSFTAQGCIKPDLEVRQLWCCTVFCFMFISLLWGWHWSTWLYNSMSNQCLSPLQLC